MDKLIDIYQEVSIIMWWESRHYTITSACAGLTPIDLLEQLGKEGRKALLSVLIINHQEEVAQMLKKYEEPSPPGACM